MVFEFQFDCKRNEHFFVCIARQRQHSNTSAQLLRRKAGVRGQELMSGMKFSRVGSLPSCQKILLRNVFSQQSFCSLPLTQNRNLREEL